MNCGAAAARALRKLPLVDGVGTGCQPVPGHILHLGIFVNPGSRLAAGTYCPELTRGAAEKSLTVSVLNELRPSRGKRSPDTSLAEILTGVGAERTLACRSTTEARAPGGAPEYKPGVSPRTPGKACIAGQALNERQTSCGQRPSAGGLREVRVQAGSLDLPGPGLTARRNKRVADGFCSQ